jgi:hypothetical protein
MGYKLSRFPAADKFTVALLFTLAGLAAATLTDVSADVSGLPVDQIRISGNL